MPSKNPAYSAMTVQIYKIFPKRQKKRAVVVREVVPKVWIKLLGPLYGLYQPLLFASSLEQCLNSAGYNRHICCRLKASDYITLTVDKELCEIPLNIRLRCVVGVCLREYLIEDGR